MNPYLLNIQSTMFAKLFDSTKHLKEKTNNIIYLNLIFDQIQKKKEPKCF